LAASAFATATIAERFGLRPEPFYLGIAYAVLGLLLSVLAVRETRGHVALETSVSKRSEATPSQAEVFRRTTFTDPNLSSATQAGLVNNLNDGMAWGLFPLWFAAQQMGLQQIGILAAVYPAIWGVLQLATGAWSDRVGRKWLIATGMWVQAAGIAIVLVFKGMNHALIGTALLGVGTAMVYPTLLAAISDVTHPSWRASSVGVYRLWRDLGYAFGAILSGAIADALGLSAAIAAVAAVTFASGVVVAFRMRETLPARLQVTTQ
jgi:MFS family permease